MANRQTTANLRRRNDELTIQEHETDSPILPVAQLERLHSFRPDAVDLVLTQTKIEAEHRRSETKRVNTFIFVERIAGQLFGLLIGLSGMLGGVYTAVNGQPAAGISIAGVTVGTLAVAFVLGRTVGRNNNGGKS